MAYLFSQIPYAVLDKAGCARRDIDEKPGPKSRRKRKYSDKFYEEDEVRPTRDLQKLEEGEEGEEGEALRKDRAFSSPPPLEEASIQDDSFHDQISSSHQDPPKKIVETFDAINQTTPLKMVSREVQTDESMATRPLSDNDIHRMNLQTFSPVTPIPRPDGANPPLRIGLTLKGKKRKVYYPDLENVENYAS